MHRTEDVYVEINIFIFFSKSAADACGLCQTALLKHSSLIEYKYTTSLYCSCTFKNTPPSPPNHALLAHVLLTFCLPSCNVQIS